MGTVSVQLGLLAVAKDRANADLSDLETAAARATGAGHRVMVREVVGDSEAAIRLMLERWIADPAIDVILVLGGADSDAVSNALRPLVGHMLPGFTDLFRLLFFQEVGAAAMLSAAEAARCTDTFVFVMPGAVGAAMDQLILPQFDPTTKKNLVGQMPRLRAERENAPQPAVDEGSAGHGVPREVPPEKTQGGSGVSARLPAMPAPKREQKRTGANVIARNPAPQDPPTKPIELAKLEQQIAASQAKEDVTRRTDLQKLLPRVPPGADDVDDDGDDGDGDDVTHADIIAAPPAKPFTVPAIAKPAPAAIARITPVPAAVKPATAAKPVTPIVVPKVHLDRTVPADRITPLPEGVTPAPVGKTPLPSIAKPASSTSKPVETKPAKVDDVKPPESETARFDTVTPPMATPAPVTIQPRKREAGEAKANGTAKQPPVTDEAVTKARAVVEEPPATADEAPTTAKPASPRSSGSIGVLSDADIEPVDTDGEEADLDAIRAAATAQSDEAPTVSRAEPVRVKQPTPPPVTMVTAVPPAPAPARTRPPTAPPPAKATAPAPTASATDAPRARPATTPPPPRTTSELPRGTFNYPVQKRGMHWAVKLFLVLVVLGAGFGGFVFFFRDKLTGGGEQSAKTNEGATVEIDAAVVASAEIDAAVEDVDAAVDEPEIEMTPTPSPTKVAATQRSTREKPPRGERPPKNPPPDKVATTTPDAGTELPAPPTGPSNTPEGTGDDDCDETACVLSKYEKPCCAKFKPAESTDLTLRTAGGVPETLDKTMVRAGVNVVKPKVQKCGEKIAVKGTVKIAMEVSPDGAVTGASVADAPDAALGECVAAAMKLAKFGKSVNGGSFTYPFVF